MNLTRFEQLFGTPKTVKTPGGLYSHTYKGGGEAHVIKFGDETFLGQARTHVKSVRNAILYTRAEALQVAKPYEPGTFSIIPLSAFDLSKEEPGS